MLKLLKMGLQTKSYDNILFISHPIAQNIRKVQCLINFKDEYNLTLEEARQVFDYFPVYAEFDISNSDDD